MYSLQKGCALNSFEIFSVFEPFPGLEESIIAKAKKTIGEETQFKVDEEGCLVISFPAGTVTDAANGVQQFRIQKVAIGQKG